MSYKIVSKREDVINLIKQGNFDFGFYPGTGLEVDATFALSCLKNGKTYGTLLVGK